MIQLIINSRINNRTKNVNILYFFTKVIKCRPLKNRIHIQIQITKYDLFYFSPTYSILCIKYSVE